MQTTLPLWVTLLALAIGPAVGGAIALLGAFGGPWLKARTEVDQWRRDKRLDACADLARSIHDLTEAIAQRRDAFGGQEVESARQAVERAQYELMPAAARVQLVGPPALRNASVALARYVTEVTSALRTDTPGPALQLVAISEGLNQRYDVFMDAARRDLGVS